MQGWPLEGPRTARWCLQYLDKQSTGFEGHHERLRSLLKLDAGAWGIAEHYNILMAVKLAVEFDQVAVENLSSFELLFRRLQTIEFAYQERLRDQEAKSQGGSRLSPEEQS
eukprot:6196242-Amphidinium_carterae.1